MSDFILINSEVNIYLNYLIFLVISTLLIFIVGLKLIEVDFIIGIDMIVFKVIIDALFYLLFVINRSDTFN